MTPKPSGLSPFQTVRVHRLHLNRWPHFTHPRQSNQDGFHQPPFAVETQMAFKRWSILIFLIQVTLLGGSGQRECQAHNIYQNGQKGP
jgi:hypothetical protein